MQNIKDYSGWLIVSDIDGTLNNKIRKTPIKNLNAIRDFIDHNGYFTLASARVPESMFRHFKKLPSYDIPGIVMNGAGIYDFKNKKMIEFTPLNEVSVNVIIDACKQFKTLDCVVCAKENTYNTGIGIWGKHYLFWDKIKHENVRNIEDIPKDDWGKVIFMGVPFRVRQLIKYIEGQECNEFFPQKTSFFSYEMTDKTVNKGSAVHKLASILGVDDDHIAAIGDYYNDLDMLKSVHIPGCAGNAPKALKNIADYVTCHCNEGAVADFIGYLINNRINILQEA